jgi:hypothetical protein
MSSQFGYIFKKGGIKRVILYVKRSLTTKYEVRCRSLCEGCIAFDKSAHLFVDLPVLKVTFSGIQADLSCTPQISFAEKTTSFISV